MKEFNGNAVITVMIAGCCSMFLLSVLVSTSTENIGPTHTCLWLFALIFVPVQALLCPLRNWMEELIWNKKIFFFLYYFPICITSFVLFFSSGFISSLLLKVNFILQIKKKLHQTNMLPRVIMELELLKKTWMSLVMGRRHMKKWIFCYCQY